MRIYMDTCCYTRIMDDQTQIRIYLESNAIQVILQKCDRGELEMANSSIIMLELNRIFDEKKKKLALGIMETLSRAELSLTKEVELRAKDFQNYGVKIFDSYHLAIAEFAQIEHLITVDDQFINAAKRTNAKVKVVNPMMFIMEELKNE